MTQQNRATYHTIANTFEWYVNHGLHQCLTFPSLAFETASRHPTWKVSNKVFGDHYIQERETHSLQQWDKVYQCGSRGPDLNRGRSSLLG